MRFLLIGGGDVERVTDDDNEKSGQSHGTNRKQVCLAPDSSSSRSHLGTEEESELMSQRVGVRSGRRKAREN